MTKWFYRVANLNKVLTITATLFPIVWLVFMAWSIIAGLSTAISGQFIDLTFRLPFYLAPILIIIGIGLTVVSVFAKKHSGADSAIGGIKSSAAIYLICGVLWLLTRGLLGLFPDM